MAHPRVEQLRFARAEWQRGLAGLSETDGAVRLEPMNSISWMVGHLAWHERLCWFRRAQGSRSSRSWMPSRRVSQRRSRSLEAMWAAWDRVVAGADAFLEGLTTADLEQSAGRTTRARIRPSLGSQLQYVTYHYWSHIGEVSAVRQILGHQGLAEFVGDLPPEAEYRREG